MFVTVPVDFLKEIARDEERLPKLYYHSNWLLRNYFWMRLRFVARLISRHQKSRERGLDFCGGIGVMLPTLSKLFSRTVSIDLFVDESIKIKKKFEIENVEIVQSDITNPELNFEKFDSIVAADVLEHFKDLNIPISKIADWLAEDGLLYTSLPTENFLYRALRRVIGAKKPFDHYHTSYEVEQFLSANGFERVDRICVPLYFPLFPLFSICAWKRNSADL